jgi:hypothetical protein
LGCVIQNSALASKWSFQHVAKKQPPARRQSAYDALRVARALIRSERITLTALAGEVGIPPTTLSAMLKEDYTNKTIDALDAIRDAVKRVREQATA